MRVNWQSRKLGKILSLQYGKPLPKADRLKDGLFPVYGANGVKCYSNRCLHEKQSIIVGRKGSAGEVNLTEDRFWPLDVTYFVKHDESQFDLKFLFYLLSMLDLPSLAKGVKPGINRNEVYGLEVSFPPLPEQERIVEILDEAFEAIDKAIANTERNIRNAEELFKSILNGQIENSSYSWKHQELQKDIRFIDYRGKTPKKVDEGLRLITAKNVKPGVLNQEPMEYVAPNTYTDWMKRGIPKEGDVLFTTEAPLGNVAILNTSEKVVFAQRIITLQPDRSKMNSMMLHFALRSERIQHRIRDKATGATAKGIRASLLKKLVIPLPCSIRDQCSIATELKLAEDFSKSLELQYQNKQRSLGELRQSLLQKAFAGELIKDFREVDKALSEAGA